MNIVEIDPLFYTLFAARFDAKTIEATPSTSCAQPYRNALSTKFDLATRSGELSANFNFRDALINIAAPSEDGSTSHYVVAQFDGGLIAAVYKKSQTLETMAGNFISCPDVFTLDALSEIWATSYLKTAQHKIIEKVATLLTPVLSGETGRMLGQMLGKNLTPQAAERFADPFFENLLKNTNIRKN